MDFRLIGLENREESLIDFPFEISHNVGEIQIQSRELECCGEFLGYPFVVFVDFATGGGYGRCGDLESRIGDFFIVDCLYAECRELKSNESVDLIEEFLREGCESCHCCGRQFGV